MPESSGHDLTAVGIPACAKPIALRSGVNDANIKMEEMAVIWQETQYWSGDKEEIGSNIGFGAGSLEVFMRTLIVAVASSSLLIASSVSSAADLSPGLWEITMETRVAATPGFVPAPFKMTQCFTAEDTLDPARLLGQIANPGAAGCTFSKRDYVGNSLSFTMECAGTLAIVSTGQVAFTTDTMEGSITATANIGGTSVKTQNKVSARRVGGC